MNYLFTSRFFQLQVSKLILSVLQIRKLLLLPGSEAIAVSKSKQGATDLESVIECKYDLFNLQHIMHIMHITYNAKKFFQSGLMNYFQPV